MIAPRIAFLVAALVLTASVGITVGGCDLLTEPDDPGPPALRVQVSVTPDTARPDESVLVRSIVRHYRGPGCESHLNVRFWKDEGQSGPLSLDCASRDLPFLSGGRADTVEVWCQLSSWLAPASLAVVATVNWSYGTDSPDDCDGHAVKAGRPDSYICFASRSGKDVLMVVP